MKQQIIRDYVCTHEERLVWRYVVPVGLGIVAIFAVILLTEAFRIRNSIGVWLFAFALLAFSLCTIVSYRKVCVIPFLAFSIEQSHVTNSCPKGNIVDLDLSASYFCTMFTCSFAYGTATTKKAYFLFSEMPFNLGAINQNGFYALERISRSKVIIIPRTEITEVWAQQVLKVNRIPVYPAVAFKQGLFVERNVTGEGQRDSSLS